MNNHEISRPKSLLRFCLGLALLVTIESLGLAAGPVRTIRLALPEHPGAVTRRAGEILARQVTARCEAKIATVGEAEFAIELSIASGAGAGGYRIIDGSGASVRIVGNDERGLLYCAGKFLRTSR